MLNREVVPFFGDTLRAHLNQYRGLDAIKKLVIQNEVDDEEYVERLRYPSRLACFGQVEMKSNDSGSICRDKHCIGVLAIPA